MMNNKIYQLSIKRIFTYNEFIKSINDQLKNKSCNKCDSFYIDIIDLMLKENLYEMSSIIQHAFLSYYSHNQYNKIELILDLLSKIEYKSDYLSGLGIIPIACLSSSNIYDIKWMALECIEQFQDYDYINILKNIDFINKDLNEYKNEIIEDLIENQNVKGYK